MVRNMIRYIIVLFCFSYTTAYSQQIKPTIFGLKIGFNNSVINGIELDGDKTGLVGYELYASLFSNSKLNEKLNLENEILFSYTDDFIFMEFPIHLKYKIRDLWSILFGTKIDFIPTENINSKYKPMGVSAELGVQYDINKRYFAELRVSKGFTKQIDDFILEIYDGKRNTFRFGLGVNF